MAVSFAPAAWQFGSEPVAEAVLSDDSGAQVTVMAYAAAIRDWQIPVAGKLRSIVLGFDDASLYPAHSPHFGAVAGRFAGRIRNATFALDGRKHRLTANDGPHHLHGGPGFGARIWSMQPQEEANAVVLQLASAAGEHGYPGSIAAKVTYALANGCLTMRASAEVDEPTPVNLTQHSYFNLAGRGDVRGHRLMLAAARRLERDAAILPTGAIADVADTPHDFREMRAVGTLADELDDCFVLDAPGGQQPQAVLEAPDGSVRLALRTDQPAIVAYGGGKLGGEPPGLGGLRYAACAGLCLEAQFPPDCVNQPELGDCIARPERPYAQETSWSWQAR